MTKPDAEKLVDDFEDATFQLAFEPKGTDAAKHLAADYARIRSELIEKLVSAP